MAQASAIPNLGRLTATLAAAHAQRVMVGAAKATAQPSAAECEARLLSFLRERVTRAPVLTIGGDRLTGKSTLAVQLRERLFPHATVISAGTVFRAVAAERGMTVAQLSVAALSEPTLDTEIELRMCERIAQGVPTPASAKPGAGLLLVEGRQPAVVAAFLRTVVGKQNVLSLRLTCNARSQALRLLRREVGADAVRIAVAAKTADEVAALLASSPGAVKALAKLADEEHRDTADLKRFEALYGLNYTDARLYDILLDTSDPIGVAPNEANIALVTDAVERILREKQAAWLALTDGHSVAKAKL